MSVKNMPKWQREQKSFLGIKSGFILEGNIHDDYPSYEMEDGELTLYDFDNLDMTLLSLAGEHARVIFCDPLYGFYNYEMTEEEQKKLMDPYMEGYHHDTCVMGPQQRVYYVPNGKKGCHGSAEAAELQKQIWMSEIVRRGVTTRTAHPDGEKQVIFVLNFASRLEHCNLRPADANTMFLNLQAAMQDAYPGEFGYNTVIMVVDKYNDIPAWVYLMNPNIRTIHIEAPDRSTRREFLGNLAGKLKPYAVLSDEKHEAGAKLVAETEGYLCRELRQILELSNKEGIGPDEVEKAFQLYKYGISDNPWDNLEENIIEHIIDTLESRVKGQEMALKRVGNVAKRAAKGLSGLQHSSASSKPRGILFLAGPTGVGKTETAKALAQAIFGDESACIRFDMSEYRLEQSDQKLFGAPPGYVGYEGGGQLTNAVKNRPFSVLLFDEIEKASPTILDKFLQILEDGRMTDNQGNTVYFGESIIIFTSNIGLTKPVYDDFGREMRDASGNILKEPTIKIENPELPDTPEFKKHVTKTLVKGVKDYFTNIGRPELLNRLGEENIVVFHFIDKEAAEIICEAKVKSICDNIKKQKNIEIRYDAVLPELKHLAVMERNNGGRGVGNMLETEFLNPFAEYYCSVAKVPEVVVCRLDEKRNIVFGGV